MKKLKAQARGKQRHLEKKHNRAKRRERKRREQRHCEQKRREQKRREQRLLAQSSIEMLPIFPNNYCECEALQALIKHSSLVKDVESEDEFGKLEAHPFSRWLHQTATESICFEDHECPLHKAWLTMAYTDKWPVVENAVWEDFECVLNTKLWASEKAGKEATQSIKTMWRHWKERCA